MSGKWPKIIRDPVHNLISFEKNDIDQLLLKLIDTREFQRLRRIKQLGMSELVFPGASHSRFAHSLGVMHVTRRILDRLRKITGRGEISDEHRMIVLCAALLHDTGHGPFSHAFESVTKQTHEERTVNIIEDDSTEVHQCLVEVDPELPERVAAFFDEDPESSQSSDVPVYLTHVVSSQLDADRFDYLLRDSHATGTDYGKFDLDWIIEHLCVNTDKNFVYLDRKSTYVAEAYVFARHHMYQTVYFHKATRAAEVMLKLLFQRYQDIVKEDANGTIKDSLKDVPSVVRQAFGPNHAMTLDDYLRLDDHMLSAFMASCALASDPILSRLGQGLTQRRLYKGIEVPGDAGTKLVHFSNEAQEILAKEELDPDFCFVEDTAADTPYRPYDPLAQKKAKLIFVEDGQGEVKELSTLAKPVQGLCEKIQRVRYYYPDEIRDKIEQAANNAWGGHK